MDQESNLVPQAADGTPGLESQAVGGDVPGLVSDPAPTPEVDGACALARTVTGVGNQLQVALVLQASGLGGETAQGLGLDSRGVEEVSEKPRKNQES